MCAKLLSSLSILKQFWPDISKQHLGILNVIKDEAKKIKDELVNNIQTLTSTLASLNKEIEDKKNNIIEEDDEIKKL